ncbi:MAG: crossover junction endodeoxyribonuclease RuvC [Clostridia bacterium]|nr:crossover junction endodeoxyribonuclease RuvC [Clostridia bacterium]
MRILGIDPGYAIIGWGVLDYESNKFSVVDYGAITTPAGMPFPRRIELIYEEITAILERLKPDALAMEKLYFTNNKTTGIDVAQARGVLLLAAARAGLEIHEYTPVQVKQGVVGYGKAEKKQVMEMTRVILNLPEVPKPDDTADALALAICHAHVGGSILGTLEQQSDRPLKIRKGI